MVQYIVTNLRVEFIKKCTCQIFKTKNLINKVICTKLDYKS